LAGLSEGIASPPGDPFTAFGAGWPPVGVVASAPVASAPVASAPVARSRRGAWRYPPIVGAAFVDLDRTLLRRASGPVLGAALVAEGIVPSGRSLPGERLFYALYDRFGENLVAMALARAAALVARGWSQQAVRDAGRRAVAPLAELVAPFAPGVLAELRRQGHRLVLATTTPVDLVHPFAEAMGFDDVLGTVYEVVEGHYSGRLEGGFVWGLGKLQAVRRWVAERAIDLADCHAFSDSLYDVPLLSSVGSPHAVNPDPSLLAVAISRRWPVEHWDRPPGVPSLAGLEPYHLLRPFVRPEAFPYARFDVAGIEHVPDAGPVLLAANHRSYFDVAALAVVAARLGRPVRFLAKRELFDAPVLGWAARALGGIPVERGSGSERPLRQAEAALRAGEVVIVLPQGTIPRGPAFFDPVLRGRTGTARLAAATGAPVLPLGLWGTEEVWPRSSRLPKVAEVWHPPMVRVRVGQPVPLGLTDAAVDTEAIMRAISQLLPPQAAVRRQPSEADLARTYPPGAPGRHKTPA
jgi:putative phosphoserine phosphatase/1-acylglycerol-3-phosphate O-acyltransferase